MWTVVIDCIHRVDLLLLFDDNEAVFSTGLWPTLIFTWELLAVGTG